ncbi:polysaccharide biosynthesis tyrosine autokinase [Nocardioides sp.]|uniref:polysaccharide biosynthesis tyrosine autokinase n=1 Tax=Nocardioides sp. TaxID=35761 RepID=UPI003564AB82
MELRDHLRMLAMHWFGVLLIAALVVSGAAAYTFSQTKIYAADANGFVSTGSTGNAALGSINDDFSKSRATSYVDIAKSRATAQEVIDDLGLDASPAGLVGKISVEQPLDTVLIKITARDETPEGAQKLADAWVKALATQVQQIEDPQQRERTGTPRVITIESAELPTSPVAPQPERNLALALLVGLALGYAYALLRHTLDRRLRTPQAIQDRFQVSVVGTIPMVGALGQDPSDRQQVVLSQADGTSRQRDAAEAFRKLRTNLIFMDVDHPPQVIVVTSPRPGDGKSTVAANLAAAVAYSGQKVALVDGDLRRPTVARSLQVDGDIGLTDVLVGRLPLSDGLQQSDKHANLFVLPAGRIPPNPSELVGSQAMRTMLEKLSQDYLVIIDAPPLLPVTDAAILTAAADGAFVVVSAGRTLDTELGQALSHLEAVSGKALGIILNKTSRRAMGGYYYYESAYYGEEPGANPSTGESRSGSKRKRRRKSKAGFLARRR